MTTKAKLQTTIENAIAKADTNYFFEDYTKQAKAVIAALDAAGFMVITKDLPEDTWKFIGDNMKTGRVSPIDHVKDVFMTGLKNAALK